MSDKKIILLAFIIFILTPGFYYSLAQNLLMARPTPIFRSALGAETSYLIDHDLATGFHLNSPLIVGTYNFNRIFYNKVIFGMNAIIRNAISFIDFERMIMPYQGYIVLVRNLSRQALPQYLDVWQFVLVPSVIYIYARGRYKKVIPFVFVATVLFLVYGNIFFLLLIPFFAYGLAVFIFEQKKIVRYSIFGVMVISFLFSFRFFLENKDWWMDQNIVMQNKISDVLTRENLLDKSVLITDRYGKLKNVPKNISFGAFRFWKERDQNDYFIGLPSEFVQNSNESELEDGRILEKITIPRPDQGGPGGEIWIIKKF